MQPAVPSRRGLLRSSPYRPGHLPPPPQDHSLPLSQRPLLLTSGPTTDAAISIHSSLSPQVPQARSLSSLVHTNLLFGVPALPGSSSHSVYITAFLKTPPWLPIALSKIKVSLRPLLTSATCLSLWFSASRSCSFCPILIPICLETS